MVLGFKKQFEDKILKGSKIHTIREDSNDRWKAGNKIHFATGVRTKNYNQFKEGECKSIQTIEIFYGDVKPNLVTVAIDKGIIYSTLLDIDFNFLEFVKNDGFDSIESFFDWFDKDFKGKIIHWTDKRY